MRKSPSLVSSPALLRRLRQLQNESAAGSERILRRRYSLDEPNHVPSRRYTVDSIDERLIVDQTRLLAPIGSIMSPPGRELISTAPYGTQSSDLMVHEKEPSPPIALSQWLIPALLCALAYALYNIFIKKGSASIHPVLGGVILQFVAAVMGLTLLLILMYGPSQEEMVYDGNGITFAILAGLSVGVAEIISFTVNGMGVQATQSIPIIIGGSVFFGTILGKIFLEEDLSVSGWLGVVMIAGGITLVATDPKAAL